MYSFRQARASAGNANTPWQSYANPAGVFSMLRRIAGMDGSESSGDTCEASAGEAHVPSEHTQNGGSEEVGPSQLLDALNDILGRANLSLSADQGVRIRESMRLKGWCKSLR